MSSGYIPRAGAAFCPWAVNLFNYVSEHHEKWGVPAMPPDTAGRLAELEALTDKCATPNHTRLETSHRNELRKSVEKAFRNYVQGVVIRNVAVTDDDRRAMKLPVRDGLRTPVGNPAGLATASVKYYHGGVLELYIRHMEGTPFDKRANYGVNIAWDVFPFDAPAPQTASLLHRSVFTRRKKALFTFDPDSAGKKAWFCLRYENSKGRSGQWGIMISAVIP